MTTLVTPRDADQQLLTVAVGRVLPDPNNPRENLGDLTELAASLREVGMLQPIVARRTSGGQLYVVAGHRRLAAAKLAGWETVPVVVRPPMRSDDVLAAMLIENSHRRDLDPIEEARALAQLMVTHGVKTHGELAKRIGRTQGHVSRRLALLSLTPSEQAELRAGQMKIIEAVEKARMESGRVRSKRDPSKFWFGASHDLAKHAKARCLRLNHKRGSTLPGGVACPGCWESVLRADERSGTARHAAATGTCSACGSGSASRAERRAAVELLNRRGLSDSAIADRLHVVPETVLRIRKRIGLPAVTA